MRHPAIGCTVSRQPLEPTGTLLKGRPSSGDRTFSSLLAELRRRDTASTCERSIDPERPGGLPAVDTPSLRHDRIPTAKIIESRGQVAGGITPTY
jgi:hypothetical protein